MSNGVLSYKGYHSKPEYSFEDGIIHGKIEGITDLVSFESESTNSDDVVKAFQEAVDAYLEFCAEVNKSPEKEYSGTFNVRIRPELHRSLARVAFENDTSLNQEAENAIRYYLAERSSSMIEASIEKSASAIFQDLWSNLKLPRIANMRNVGMPRTCVMEG